MAALAALVEVSGPERATALNEFYDKYKSEPLVVLKWLGLQVTTPCYCRYCQCYCRHYCSPCCVPCLSWGCVARRGHVLGLPAFAVGYSDW